MWPKFCCFRSNFGRRTREALGGFFWRPARAARLTKSRSRRWDEIQRGPNHAPWNLLCTKPRSVASVDCRTHACTRSSTQSHARRRDETRELALVRFHITMDKKIKPGHILCDCEGAYIFWPSRLIALQINLHGRVECVIESNLGDRIVTSKCPTGSACSVQ
jgi:hypothetical protein